MEPNFKIGDIVIVKKLANSIEMIICATQIDKKKKIIVHKCMWYNKNYDAKSALFDERILELSRI